MLVSLSTYPVKLGVKFFFILLFSFLAIPSFSQRLETSSPWWYTLEQGKQYFRNGAYGDALLAFEDARRGRLNQFSRMEDDMILLLSNPVVRRLGDSLELIERYIAERREDSAAAAMSELYHRVPKDSLNDSARRALEELDRLKSYPEAEYWLGETYRAEGELGLALRQFERAFADRALLEIPEFDVEILYKITEIHRIRRNYQEMERRAKEIIEGRGPSLAPRDSLWAGAASNPMGSTNPPGSLLRAAMTRIMEREGIDRFLVLYRYNNPVTERAHRLLGYYYYTSARYSPAIEHLMFAFLIQNTVLIEDVIRREYDFTFTTLGSLMEYVRSRPELLAYLEETEYYRTVYYLASALGADGMSRPARELWAFLAGSADSGEWGDRARRNPAPY